jgi:hypothetical protein
MLPMDSNLIEQKFMPQTHHTHKLGVSANQCFLGDIL